MSDALKIGLGMLSICLIVAGVDIGGILGFAALITGTGLNGILVKN